MEPRKRNAVLWMTVVVILLAATVVAETAYISHLEGETGKSPDTVAVKTTSSPLDPSTPAATNSRAGQNPALDPNGVIAQGNLWNDPYAAMQQVQHRMDQLFNDSFFRMGTTGMVPEPQGLNTLNATFVPPLDLTDQGDHYTVKMDLPGTNKSNIKVQFKDGLLTVSGSRNQVAEQKDAKGHVIREERGMGEFSRTITVPGLVKQDGVTANFKDGVLTIDLPKAKPAAVETPHKIEIQ